MRMNLLLGLSFDTEKGRSQHLVPLHEFVQRVLKGIDLQLAEQPEGMENIVGRIGTFQLIQKPEPLLSKREWQVSLSCGGLERRRQWQGVLGSVGSLHGPCQVGHGGRLKHCAHGQLHLHGFAQAGENSDRQQGMAAELKKIVVAPYPVQFQHIRPDRGQHRFGRGLGGHVIRRLGGGGLRTGQGTAVDFTVGCQGEGR